MTEKKDPYLLGSVHHALQLLDLLSKHEELGVAEIHKATGFGKASVFRLLYTLEYAGYVTKSPEAKYRLSIKLAHFGSLVLNRQNVTMIARPYLQKLRDDCNQTVHLAVLGSEGMVTFLYKETSKATFQMGSSVGFSLEAYCTATGKMLLSQLPEEELLKTAYRYDFHRYTENTIRDVQHLLEALQEIREQGYSVDAEESEIGLTCFAAPVYDISGSCIAAISVSGATTRMEKDKDHIIPHLKDAAHRLSEELGHRP